MCRFRRYTTARYQSLFKDEQVLRGLIDRINVCFMRLLDPENQYPRFELLLAIFHVTLLNVELIIPERIETSAVKSLR